MHPLIDLVTNHRGIKKYCLELAGDLGHDLYHEVILYLCEKTEEQKNQLLNSSWYLFVMIAPYYWMITSSFKSVKELQEVPPTVYPKKWISGNYYDKNFDPMQFKQDVIQGLFQRYPEIKFGFFRFMFNSIFVNISITILTLFIGSLAAYVVAKHRFRGKRAIYLTIIGSMMIPWQVGLIPGFLLVDDFGWLNTYWAYIIPALPKAFIVFFLVQYLSSIPDELIEAARIDGAREFTIYWRIVLPLLKPALVAMMIPWQVGLIPGFLLVDDFGWLNTYWAYIIPALPKAFIVFFLVQYLSSIPDELIEAARIDGARLS